MTADRPQNIVIFSAGKISKKGEFVDNPNLEVVKTFFPKRDYTCCDWRELFSDAKNEKNVALLPMLIKKIPTFDFAIILADGVDAGKIRDEDGVLLMRDNVLFECGLCIMALGTKRVILLIEKGVRITDDLWGIGGIGNPAIKRIEYVTAKDETKGDLQEKMQEVLHHIDTEAHEISPVVIGAAISTADGYLSNFILRFWENIGKGFTDFSTKETIKPDLSSIRMQILIPEKIDDSVKKNTFDYYDTHGFRRGLIPDAAFRGVDFRYIQTKDQFVVCDIPSTLTASYNTVEDILHLPADDNHDPLAKARFLTKERDSFVYTLNKLMREDALVEKLKTFQKYTDPKDGAKNLEAILEFMKNQVTIETINL